MTSGWMRATSPAGNAAYEGESSGPASSATACVPRGGQSGRRDDEATGTKALRDVLEGHLLDEDIPSNTGGCAGAPGGRASAPRRTRPSSRLPRRAERRRRRRRRRRDPAPGVLANVWHPHGGRAPDNPDLITFIVAGLMVLAGAVGVILSRNPSTRPLLGADPLRDSRTVHRTAGGVPRRGPGDRLRRCHRRAVPVRHHVPRRRQAREHRERSPAGQRPLAVVLMVVVLAAVIALGVNAHWATGVHHLVGRTGTPASNTARLGRSVFTTYLFAFEATAGLLVIAVVGAVVLARRPPSRPARPTSRSPRPSVRERRRRRAR